MVSTTPIPDSFQSVRKGTRNDLRMMIMNKKSEAVVMMSRYHTRRPSVKVMPRPKAPVAPQRMMDRCIWIYALVVSDCEWYALSMGAKIMGVTERRNEFSTETGRSSKSYQVFFYRFYTIKSDIDSSKQFIRNHIFTAVAKVEIYTDGSARGNPGPGGYGVILKWGEHEKELSQGFRRTTNNRMELLAVIVGLEALKAEQLEVHIYSDSKYVVDAVTQGWVFGWVKKNFKDKKNPDLWMRFLEVYKRHKVHFHWIKGHNDHPYNERCDVLATDAADGRGLLVDDGYEAVK